MVPGNAPKTLRRTCLWCEVFFCCDYTRRFHTLPLILGLFTGARLPRQSLELAIQHLYRFLAPIHRFAAKHHAQGQKSPGDVTAIYVKQKKFTGRATPHERCT